MTREFAAPWGKLLIGMTALITVILIGIPAYGMFMSGSGMADDSSFLFVMVGIPAAIYLGALLFVVRGYKISNNELLIHRLLWSNKIELTRLRSVNVNPEAMAKSIRTFGNGGLFSFSGRFRNSELGSYRAFAMDPKKSVVLRFTDKTIVVTPDKPEEFAAALKSVISVE
jgi:hypothetical protein